MIARLFRMRSRVTDEERDYCAGAFLDYESSGMSSGSCRMRRRIGCRKN